MVMNQTCLRAQKLRDNQLDGVPLTSEEQGFLTTHWQCCEPCAIEAKNLDNALKCLQHLEVRPVPSDLVDSIMVQVESQPRRTFFKLVPFRIVVGLVASILVMVMAVSVFSWKGNKHLSSPGPFLAGKTSHSETGNTVANSSQIDVSKPSRNIPQRGPILEPREDDPLLAMGVGHSGALSENSRDEGSKWILGDEEESAASGGQESMIDLVGF